MESGGDEGLAEPAALEIPPLPPGAQTSTGLGTHSAAPSDPPPTRSGKQSFPLAVVSLLCLLATAGIVLFTFSRLSSDDRTADVVAPSVRDQTAAEAEAPDDEAISDDAAEIAASDEGTESTIAVTGTSAPTTATTPPTTPTTVQSTRAATLYAGVARVRAGPALDDAVLFEITNRSGASLTVLTPLTDGWYQVDFEGSTGWIFGAFVLPADEGFFVAETVDDNPAVLLTSSGSRLGIDNPSGNKVLVQGLADEGRYQVVLPDGSTGWVQQSAVRLVG